MRKSTPPIWHGPTPQRWEWPPEYDALDRLERELVEDVAAAILAAKVARRDASDALPVPHSGRVPAAVGTPSA